MKLNSFKPGAMGRNYLQKDCCYKIHVNCQKKATWVHVHFDLDKTDLTAVDISEDTVATLDHLYPSSEVNSESGALLS